MSIFVLESTTRGGARHIADAEVRTVRLFGDLARGLGKGLRRIGNGLGARHKYAMGPTVARSDTDTTAPLDIIIIIFDTVVRHKQNFKDDN